MRPLITTSKEPSESSSEYAYRALRESIMSLALRPGSKIEEGLLTKQLQISRTPAREALMGLKQENLIEILPQKKSIVTLIDFTLVHEALFLRSALEPNAIAEASRLLTDHTVTALCANLQAQQEVLETTRDFPLFFKLDNEFHRVIYEAAGFKNIWRTIQALSTHYDRLRYLDILTGTISLRPLYLQHREIYQSMLAKKTQHLEEYIKGHLSSFLTTKTFLEPPYRSYFARLP